MKMGIGVVKPEYLELLKPIVISEITINLMIPAKVFT